MNLKSIIRESVTFTIPILKDRVSFAPGDSYNLIFTAKRKESDPDEKSVFQKQLGAGIVIDGASALVTLVYEDTDGLDPVTLYWDLRGQHVITGRFVTFNRGDLKFDQDRTRQPQVSVPVRTTEPPLPFANTAQSILAAVEKQEFDDDDELAAIDSANPWRLVKQKFSQRKAQLSAYFGTLFDPLGAAAAAEAAAALDATTKAAAAQAAAISTAAADATTKASNAQAAAIAAAATDATTKANAAQAAAEANAAADPRHTNERVPTTTGLASKIDGAAEATSLSAGNKFAIVVSGVLQWISEANLWAWALAKINRYVFAPDPRWINLVIEGDSRSVAGAWPTNVRLTGTTSRNVALASDTAQNMVTTYTAQITPYAPSVTGNRAALIIWAGHNDILAGRSAAQIYNDLKTIWANAIAQRYTVIAMTETPSTAFISGQNTILADLNTLILSDPSLYDFLIRPDLLFPNAANASDYTDGTHLTTAANVTLWNSILSTVKLQNNPYAIRGANTDITSLKSHNVSDTASPAIFYTDGTYSGTVGVASANGAIHASASLGQFVIRGGSPVGVFIGNSGTGSFQVQNGFNLCDNPLLFSSDGTKDIGQTASARPRNYFGKGNVTCTGLMIPGTYTVATLPTASTNKNGRAFVSDSNATHSAGIGAVVSGGGSNHVPVYSDGTDWRIG